MITKYILECNKPIMDDIDATSADVERLKRANVVLRAALEVVQWHWDTKNCEFYCASCRRTKGREHGSTCLIKHALEEAV